jgi:CRP/FNR family cyclic AMP-dependent transcriptional regulator
MNILAGTAHGCTSAAHADTCLLCTDRKPGWFCDLSPEALAEYDALSTHFDLPPGGVLFAEGQRPNSVYVLCSGHVKLTSSSRDGKTLLVRVANPGDVLGLSAAISDTTYEVAAQALGAVLVKAFKRNDFLQFIERHVEGSLHAAEMLNHEYRAALTDACRLALSGSIAGRMARLLLDLASGIAGEHTGPPHFHLSLTHEEVAAMLGRSRESVTRVLSEFKRKGILSIKGTQVVLLRKEALEMLL